MLTGVSCAVVRQSMYEESASPLTPKSNDQPSSSQALPPEPSPPTARQRAFQVRSQLRRWHPNQRRRLAEEVLAPSPSALNATYLRAKLAAWQHSWRSAPQQRLSAHLVVLALVLGVLGGEQWLDLSRSAPTAINGEQATAAAFDLEGDAARIILEPIEVSPIAPRLIPLDPLSPPEQRPQPVYETYRGLHSLAEGETLGMVAEQYGLSLATLIWANQLEAGDPLRVGQVLRIPLTAGRPHVVRSGETLGSLGALYSVSPAAIRAFVPNRLIDNLDLAVPLPAGNEIFIPGEMPLPEQLLNLQGDVNGIAALAPEPAAEVLNNQTNLRDGPTTENPSLSQLPAGRVVRLVGRYNDWLKIESRGLSGWVRNDLLAVAPGQIEALPLLSDFPAPPPRWVWPARGTITSRFGPRWGGFHNGLDIANRAWTPIVAARTGRVIEAGWCSGYGYCVKMVHGGGVETHYGHLVDRPVVRVGDQVQVGELIGYMGSTYDRAGGGYSTGVHLHLTVLVNGRAVDRLRFLA